MLISVGLSTDEVDFSGNLRATAKWHSSTSSRTPMRISAAESRCSPGESFGPGLAARRKALVAEQFRALQSG